MTDRAERAARAALTAAVEPAHGAVARRIISSGAAATWAAIVRGDEGLDRRGTLRRRSAGVDGVEILRAAAGQGLRFIGPEDSGWPPGLRDLPLTMSHGADSVPAPYGLWVRGRCSPDELRDRSVAVVGARAATAYGMRVAGDLGADLAGLGWTVVSGAAYGIDAAVHRGSLAMDGQTAAVLACGIDVAYPAAHAELLERIARAGLIMSELAPGLRPMRSRFLARNRIIAGLTRGTVVVEAAGRSGALSTAHWAEKLGRDVMMVPGPVTSELSAGCHAWIRDRHAHLVSDADEVVDVAGRLGEDAAPSPEVSVRPLDPLHPDVRDVYEHLPAVAAVRAAALSLSTGLDLGTVERALVTLSEAGLVRWVAGAWERVPGAARR